MDICKTCQYYTRCNGIKGTALLNTLWRSLKRIRDDASTLKGEMIDTFPLEPLYVGVKKYD